MKIVLVMDQYDNSNNGTTVTARRLAENLRSHGHTVTILAGGDAQPGKLCAKKHTIPFFQKLIEAQGMCFAKPDPALYYQAFQGADIVHFFLPFRFCRMGEKYARQMNIPCVAAFHVQPENITSSIFLEKCKAVNRFLYHWFYKAFYNRFDFIHCPSEFIASQLENHGYAAQTRVISNGVAKEFVRLDLPARNDGIIKILMVGRLSREKRQDLIIRAAGFSRYSDRIQLIFAGMGPRKKQYQKLSKGLAHPPVFSFYSQNDLLHLLNTCDLYVHASDAEIEGISCLEAMACGLTPVISDSPLSAARQFALHENSLFRAGDPQDLSNKIDFWIEHPQLKEEFSRRHIRQQDENRVDQCVRKMEDMYAEAIEKVRRFGYKSVPAGRFRRFFSPSPDTVNRKFFAKGKWPALRTKLLGNFVGIILLLINKLCFGFRVEGKEHLKQLSGGAVTVCNHIHYLDCVMVKAACLSRGLWITSLRENFTIPVIGYLIRGLGAVALDSSPAEQSQLNQAMLSRISAGELVHFYPEGMLIPYYQGLRKLHGGAFSSAVHANCPVLPMALCQRKGRGLFRLKRKPCLTLRILPPVFPNPALSARQARLDLMRRVEQAMRAQLGSNISYFPAEGPLPSEKNYSRKA